MKLSNDCEVKTSTENYRNTPSWPVGFQQWNTKESRVQKPPRKTRRLDRLLGCKFCHSIKKKYFCHLDFDHITRASYRPLYTSFRSIKEFPLWQCSSHSKSNCIMLPSYLVRQSRDETCNSITTWDWWECFRAYHFQLLTLSSVNVYTNENCLYPHYYKPSQIFRVKSSSCL